MVETEATWWIEFWEAVVRPILLLPMVLFLPYLLTRWLVRWRTGTASDWFEPILYMLVILVLLASLWFLGTMFGCLLGFTVEGLCSG